ncbi:hypothetical protein GP475_08980 [Corynebacterium poyangense]|uniref:Uncharacterized protein n=1 Tax=Corynebacterium poyangense TaxID=2684405 RepID=A0A7H0SQD5_9CORY|nr:hypothetical protein [Corynebacterium poyangense]MBZ8178357.1 hypothetical protein [Corynebacterium poyangense]QNQ90760.1 hypothetical protein GP475_08980 [Corynebacterium poyangense]
MQETGLVIPFEVTNITVTKQQVALTLTGEVNTGEEEVLIIAERTWED